MAPSPQRSLADLFRTAPDPPEAKGEPSLYPLTLALILASVLVWEAATRPQAGSPDAYQYLDVAANLAEGRGLVQSVPGYNSGTFPIEPSWPQPFTSQPPLYPWLGSHAIRLGFDPTAALATLAAVGVALSWLVGAALTRWMWGRVAAECAFLGLAVCALSPTLTTRVWSDPLGITFTLLSLVGLLGAHRSEHRATAWSITAGVFAGLAFHTRYVFGLLIPFGVLWLLSLQPAGRRSRQAIAFALTTAAFTFPVLGRNLALTGGLFGEPRNPSTESLASFASNALRLTWNRLPVPLQWVAAFVIGGALLWVLLSSDSRSRARQALQRAAGLLPLWLVTYLVALLVLRMTMHFDVVGVRLLAPAIVVGTLVVCGFVVEVFGPLPRWAWLPVTVVLGLATLGVYNREHREPPARLERSESEFMRWLASEVPPGAILIAEDGVDFAWALRRSPGERRRIVSFSPAPYMRPLTQADLAMFVARHVSPGSPPLRLIVRGDEADAASWRRRYGDAIADAVAGREPAGDGLVLEREIDGKRILRWRTAAASSAGIGQPH